MYHNHCQPVSISCRPTFISRYKHCTNRRYAANPMIKSTLYLIFLHISVHLECISPIRAQFVLKTSTKREHSSLYCFQIWTTAVPFTSYRQVRAQSLELGLRGGPGRRDSQALSRKALSLATEQGPQTFIFRQIKEYKTGDKTDINTFAIVC